MTKLKLYCYEEKGKKTYLGKFRKQFFAPDIQMWEISCHKVNEDKLYYSPAAINLKNSKRKKLLRAVLIEVDGHHYIYPKKMSKKDFLKRIQHKDPLRKDFIKKITKTKRRK